MSSTKTASLLFATNTNVPAGTTRASPVVGNVIPVTNGYGGMAHVQITNGASAPTIGCTVELQASPDGTMWTFYDQVLGDSQPSTSNGGGSGSIPVDKAVQYVRPIAYGNTVNAVTVNGEFTNVTGL